MSDLVHKYKKAIAEEASQFTQKQRKNLDYRDGFEMGAEYILRELAPQLLRDYAQKIQDNVNPDRTIEEFLREESK